MDKLLENKIRDSEIISFDIFDTLIVRRVARPEDVFKIIEFKLKQKKIDIDFFHLRKKAEEEARNDAWESSRKFEITLNDIYNKFPFIEGVNVSDIYEMEVDTEIQVCTSNLYMQSIYRYCKDHGKPIIITSDMYLPLEVVQMILANSGYTDYKQIFLSSQVCKTKSDGSLYEYVIDSLDIMPEKILHIGDNYTSDIMQAKKHRINAYYYKKSSETINTGEYLFDVYNNHSRSLQESLFAATIINKYKTLRGIEKSEFWYDFGYREVGILFFGFIKWLIEEAEKKNIERVFFLSRDGFILKKVYDLFYTYRKEIPSSVYMYASRRALNIAGIKRLGRENIEFLESGTSILTVSQFLSRIGLKADEFSYQIRDAGFTNSEDKVINGADYEKLRKLYWLINNHINHVAKIEREAYLEYLESIDFFESERVGIVDIGWHGSMQLSLINLLSSTKQIDLCGFYLGTFGKAKLLVEKGLSLSSYLCNCGSPIENELVIKQCVEIFELIHSAPHGSFIKFEKSDSGRIPFFDSNDLSETKLNKIAKIQKGAMDFVQDLLVVIEKSNLWDLEFANSFTLQPLKRVLENPTVEEAFYLGDIEHAEGFGDVYMSRYIAKPPSLSKIIKNPFSLKIGFQQSFWKNGYKKRIPKQVLLFYRYIKRFKNAVKKAQ